MHTQLAARRSQFAGHPKGVAPARESGIAQADERDSLPGSRPSPLKRTALTVQFADVPANAPASEPLSARQPHRAPDGPSPHPHELP